MIEDSSQNIIPINIEEEMKGAYIDYSMSVIVSRALPDVRDGLKPVHRRVLYGMLEMGVNYNKSFKKSGRIVGDVMGKYHPHGDSSVYETMVRMAQPWSLRYILVDGQGNFGSIDGDSPAAMRYTEAKLKRISDELLSDINKDTVDFQPNYDDTLKEPTVLPSKFPNLLVNGASGIAVGMATNMAPHNLTEVIEGTIHYIENNECSVQDLMGFIKAPDFPTGGIIYGYQGVKSAFETGKGRIVMRAKATIEQNDKEKDRIIVSEIPYMVNKASMIEKTAHLINDKKIEGISDIRDESNREGIRVAIDLRRGVEPETVKRQLYKYTAIESSFGFNTLAIVDQKPKTCNLKEFLEHFLKFRQDVVTKKTKFDLRKAEERAHILIGLSVSVENLDKVIKIIRNSKNPEEAKISILKTKWKINKSKKLISLVEDKRKKDIYNLSEEQVNAILELRLQKLTALGINEIEVEIKKLAELISKYKKIISSKKELLKVISEELKNIREKYSTPRRTKIIDAVLNYDIEETIQKQSVLITITLQGYIKRGFLKSVKTQKRGGKGKTGITTRNEDSVVQTLSVNTHTSVLFFSTEGLVYRIKAWKIPEGSAASKGKSLFNILPLKNHQSISSIMPFPDDDSQLKNYHIVFATSGGKIRKNSLEDFSSINSAGKIAMKLDNNDKIVGVKICKDDQDIILSTKLGKCIRFESKKLRVFKGRSSKGIKGIVLAPQDQIVSLSIIDNDKGLKDKKKSKDNKSELKAREKFILSITENGYGKKTPHVDYRVTNRGGKGIIGIVNSPRNGNISSSFPVFDGDEILISTNKGRVIRVAVKEIRTAGRNTQGVRIIKLSGEEKVVSADKIDDNLV